ncbi:inositol monophosphatase family protein [Candidatus Omnitrophota bacterium]
MSDFISVGVAAAKEAGDFLLENFGKISQIESKGDRSLATNVDKGAEKIIVDTIQGAFPSHGIVAEESGVVREKQEYLWIIDPLDGTHNFIRDINIFGVCIGLLRNREFIGGIIYMPVDRELYVAEKGGGAFKNDKKITVSPREDLSECSLSFDSSISKNADVMSQVLHDVALHSFNVRMFGSSARILSYIAEGKLDATIEFHDLPWDFAGSVCIIREAGGEITGLMGESLTYKSVGYIASNGRIHGKLKNIVSQHHIIGREKE